MSEIFFTVEESPEGGYEAKALGHSIFTEADDLDSLYKNIKEAVSCHFEESDQEAVNQYVYKDKVIKMLFE